MDAIQLGDEGYYSTFGTTHGGTFRNARGCSLCMGNQALVSDLALLLFRPLYTRNFPNRLGQGANFYLASAELAAVASIEGKLPSVDKYI